MTFNLAQRSPSQRGFTLVELVVVIAILGVLSAVAVPFITRHLEESKDRAYDSDRERFQQAVDAYYSSPSNENFLGNPQYPIMGMSKTTGTFLRTFQADEAIREHHTAAHIVNVSDSPHDHTIINPNVNLGNPLRGTQGGAPKWIDDGNGIRDGGEEELLDSDADSLNKPGWHVDIVTREGVRYTVDSRDYFIDFDKLAAKSLLDQVPASASPDNRPQDPPDSFNLLTAEAGPPDNQAPAGLTISPPTATVAFWVVDDGSNRVFRYSLDGTLVESFPLDNLNGNGDPSGIATDGSRLLVLDESEEKVYRYNMAGGPQGSFDVTTASDGLVGITTDGESIWILNVDSDGNGEVFRYSASGTAQASSFRLAAANSAPVGITTDGREFWVLDDNGGNGLVFRYNLAGTPIGDPFAVGPVSQPGGIATDGTNIWVADRNTGTVYPFSLDGNPPGPSTPGLYTGSYSWYVDRQGKVQSLSFFFPQEDKTGFLAVYP